MSVLISELPTQSGHFVGRLTIDREKALNAINTDVVKQLFSCLQEWKNREDIVAVFLEGAGDKAFCAGGDVVAMHDAMATRPNQTPALLREFFAREYRLDYLIHQYEKPVVLWGNGIIMGGGLGLMAGASHRVVTATARIAMPEITIGLFPDVGGSWFLRNMPRGCGLFLGLTGVPINAADALYVHLADHFVDHGHKTSVIDRLRAISWGSTQALNHQKVTDVLNQCQADCQHMLPQGQVKAHQGTIDDVTQSGDRADIYEKITALIESDDKWLAKAGRTLASGSPVSAALIFEQLRRAEGLSLAQCFQMELLMAYRCGSLGEFQEGVRALLVDKDNRPQWQFDHINKVPDSITESFFASANAGSPHPLDDIDDLMKDMS